MMPHYVVTSAESEDDYLLTYRQLEISIFGVEFWMESFPLFKAVSFGYHFGCFIADLVIRLRQSPALFCQLVGLPATHYAAMRWNPLYNCSLARFRHPR
jgi:hypothetical protein